MNRGSIRRFLLTGLLLAPLPASADEPVSMAEQLESLLKADTAWSATVGDAEAFISYLAPDVYFLPPDQPRIQGADAFRAAIEELLASGVELKWTPDVAQVSANGDLGFTLGSFKLTADGPDGPTVSAVGKYATNWRRDENGDWKVVADTFNFDPSADGMDAGDKADG